MIQPLYDEPLTLTLENSVIKVNKAKATSITSIEEWTSVFTSYMSVIISKYPNRAAELLEYLSLIRYAFLRRMIDLTKAVRTPYHHIRLTRQCKEDFLLWLKFLNSFNGQSFFLSAKWLTSSNIKRYTDSAGSLGYAAVLGKRWFYGVTLRLL